MCNNMQSTILGNVETRTVKNMIPILKIVLLITFVSLYKRSASKVFKFWDQGSVLQISILSPEKCLPAPDK